jgi:hypothetical protein
MNKVNNEIAMITHVYSALAFVDDNEETRALIKITGIWGPHSVLCALLSSQPTGKAR